MELEDCAYACEYCGALFWFNEKSQSSRSSKYILCYQEGIVKLLLSKETPHIVDNLLNYYGGPESTHHRKNIRALNSMLA